MATAFACGTETRTPRRHNDIPPAIRDALQPALLATASVGAGAPARTPRHPRQSGRIWLIAKQRGRQIALPPPWSRENDLLQVGHRGQVSRELGNAGCATPVRTERSRAVAGIDRGYEARARVGGAVIAGEGVAIALREVRVGVAQIEREDLVGKADADIPGVVAGLRNAVGEGPTKGRSNGGAVERIGGSEPLPAELAGDIHADAAAAERRARRRPLAGDRCVVAPRTEVQEVRRVVLVDAELPLVVDGDIDLGVTFIKAGAFLGEVAVDWQTTADLAEIGVAAESCAVTLERSALRAEALSTRIDVTPNAEVEGEHADGRADTAVDVDFSRRAVREGDALTGGADVELHVLVDVVARLEVGGDRRLVVGLGDAAEDVIVHECAAEGEIPRLERRRRRRLDGLYRHICRERRTRGHRQHRCGQNQFLHDGPHLKTAQLRRPPGTSDNRLQPHSLT